MKRIFSIALVVLLSAADVMAQTTVSELFKAMPDSILPYLTRNNRLDMIDFMEAKMKAEVTNLLETKTEMTSLDSAHLTIRMSESVVLDMSLMNTTEAYDSCQQVICLMKTYYIQGKEAERVPAFYTVKWRPLGVLPQYASLKTSSLLRRDEEVFQKKPIE